MRVFFTKDGNQHIGASHFFFTVASGLHMHDGALDHTLKTQSGLGIHLICASHLGRVVFDEIGQRFAQVIDVGRASTQNFCGTGVVQQGQEQVLHCDEFVPLLPGLYKGHV